MPGENDWYTNTDKAFEEARRTEKPVFLFFCNDTCVSCNQIDSDIFTQNPLSDLIKSEFVALRMTSDAPDVFHNYAVKNVPAFVIAGTDGLEYERCSDIFDAEGLAAFCLLALGKVYHDRNEAETAQQHVERLINSYPQSPHAPEGVFLRGVYRYIASQDPMHLKASLFMLGKNYPDSIWVRRSLVLHFHPSTVVDWEAYRRQRRDYWESQDAYLKAWCTFYNGPSGHHFNME